ncbi:MAG: hypothetical protein H6Q89_3947, partial [Myxococcaceae bacterium]|nr:hypothetical protein [Myxococcaceae bacterium]
ISAARVLSNDPLARAPGALVRPALHPEEPKMLLSAEAAFWRARRLVEGAQAAIALDSERLHAALWSKVGERALARLKTANGDAKEGAAALAGRLYAAGACLDSAQVPPAARAIPEVAAAAEAELAAARADPDTVAPPGSFGWSRELACARVRIRMLSRPFPQSRAGAGAALTLLGLLTADPKLEASWTTLRTRRDALTAGPAKEALLSYRELSGGKVEDALENMASFIDALGEQLPPVPPPFEAATTPFSRFFAELEAAGRISAVDELLSAAQDSRLSFPAKELSPVFPRFEAALASLVSEDPNGLQVDAAWRDRRAAGFAALAGGHRDSSDDGRDLTQESDERSALKLRLLVPPTLEVEPARRAYLAAAEALDPLAAALPKLGLAAIHAVQPEGGRSAEAVPAEATRLASVLRGLAKLSADQPPVEGDPDLPQARRFLTGWRTDPAFAKDVREARALAVNQGAERLHAAIVGVARRELLVGFQSKISTTVSVAGPFEVAPAEQRYLVPVLITRAALGKATAAPLDRGALKALCETAKRQPNEIEAAFKDAMKAR